MLAILEGIFAVSDCLISIIVGLSNEGGHSISQFKQNDSEGPDIDFKGLPCIIQELW